MSVWYTSYTVRGERVKTQVQARDADDLKRIIGLRKMREELSEPSFFARSPDMPSALIKRNQPAAAHHALHWVAMIAVRCLPGCAWDLLHDRGLLHEFAHITHNLEHFDNGVSSYAARVARERRSEGHRFYKDVQALELLIPGVHPWWGDADAYANHGGFWEEVFNEARSGMRLDNAIAEMRHHIALAEANEQRRLKTEHEKALSSIDTVILPKRVLYESIFATPSSFARAAAQAAQLAQQMRLTQQAMQPMMVSLEEFSKLRDVTVYTEKPNPKPGSKESEAQARSQSAKAKAQNIERYKAAQAKRQEAQHREATTALMRDVIGRAPYVDQMQAQSRFFRKLQDGDVYVQGEKIGEIKEVKPTQVTIEAMKDVTIDPDVLAESVGQSLLDMLKGKMRKQVADLVRMPTFRATSKPRTATEQAETAIAARSPRMIGADYASLDRADYVSLETHIMRNLEGKQISYMVDPATQDVLLDIETIDPFTT